jgi:hypothetical protein
MGRGEPATAATLVVVVLLLLSLLSLLSLLLHAKLHLPTNRGAGPGPRDALSAAHHLGRCTTEQDEAHHRHT